MGITRCQECMVWAYAGNQWVLNKLSRLYDMGLCRKPLDIKQVVKIVWDVCLCREPMGVAKTT